MQMLGVFPEQGPEAHLTHDVASAVAVQPKPHK